LFRGDRTQSRTDNLHASHGRQATESPVHSVHFYEDDSLFLDSLSEFVGAALGAGSACVVVATGAHRAGLAKRLRALGIDLSFAAAMNRFISVDAGEALARFMVNGHPQEELFNAAIEPELLRARKALRGHSTSVVAFGEMVALLWQDGKHQAAIELEKLWDGLAQRHAFSLRCAYPIGLFSDRAQHELFRQVCASHHQVVPAESYTSLENENDRHRMISSLQQKAWTMRAVMKGHEEEIARLSHVERRLQRCEEFAKNVVECSVDGVDVLDLKGRLEYMSPSGIRALEIEDRSGLLGRRWVEFWKEEDWPRAEAAIASALAGEIGTFAGEFATPVGSTKWWDVRITPALDAEGHVERLVVVSRDVTDVRIAQQAAIEAEKQAMAGRLAATIAHEINNPLEAVTNFIYLAQTVEGLPEEARGFLAIADRELTRAAQITRQTLGFYRIVLRNTSVRVSDLIQDALMIYERKLRNKQITTTVAVDAEVQVCGKDGELRQALLNLTANSIDASRIGGQLWFRARRARNWRNGLAEGVRITVADNGSGMSPDVRQRIFVPFFTTKPGSGTGIGLWVTKCLIEQQGGYVHFRSRQGEKAGTVMSIFLPAPRLACPDQTEVAA
jgi:PAS domain S-box-containing protein